MSPGGPVTETKKIIEVRSELGSLAKRVRTKNARVLVERNGVPAAAIVSTADLARLEQLDEERQLAFERLDEVSKRFEDVPVDELERQVARAHKETREKYRAQLEKSADLAA